MKGMWIDRKLDTLCGIETCPITLTLKFQGQILKKLYYTIRMFPPAIDIIPTSLAVVYSNGKYTNYKN